MYGDISLFVNHPYVRSYHDHPHHNYCHLKHLCHYLLWLTFANHSELHNFQRTSGELTTRYQCAYLKWFFSEKPVSSIKSCLPCLELLVNHRKSAVFFNHCVGYHAPLDLYVEFNHMSSNLEHPFPADRYINLCVGKEWHRYPSSFFLPSDRWEKMTPKY